MPKSTTPIEQVLKRLHTTEYSIWYGMIARCYNENNTSYRNYGNRGIVVCNHWLFSFENFFKDMGTRPSHSHSIDRADNDGNYTPNNCRWATRAQQSNNTRKQRLFYAINPLGKSYIAKSKALFAREHDLSESGIGQVLLKHRPHYKGWCFQYVSSE